MERPKAPAAAPEKPKPPQNGPSEPPQQSSVFGFVGDTLLSFRDTVLKVGERAIFDDQEVTDPAERNASVRHWTKEQDEQLEKGIAANKDKSQPFSPEVWDKIAEDVTGKTGVECLDRFAYLEQRKSRGAPPSAPAARPPPPEIAVNNNDNRKSASILSSFPSGLLSSFIFGENSNNKVFKDESVDTKAQTEGFHVKTVWSTDDLSTVVALLKGPRNAKQSVVVLEADDSQRLRGEFTTAALVAFATLRGHVARQSVFEGVKVSSLLGNTYPLHTVGAFHRDGTVTVGAVIQLWRKETLPHIFISVAPPGYKKGDDGFNPLLDPPSGDPRFEGRVPRAKVLQYLLDAAGTSGTVSQTIGSLLDASPDFTLDTIDAAELVASAVRQLAFRKGDTHTSIPILRNGEFVGEFGFWQLDELGVDASLAALNQPVGDFAKKASKQAVPITKATTLAEVLRYFILNPVFDHVFLVEDKKVLKTLSIKDAIGFLEEPKQ